MTEPADEGGRRTRPFADTLRELDKGRVHAELSERLQEVIEAVLDVRKAGTVQLTLRVDATKGGDMVEVLATVAAKKPRVARASMFFVDDEHNLTRANPNQPVLPLTGLPGGGENRPADTTRSAR